MSMCDSMSSEDTPRKTNVKWCDLSIANMCVCGECQSEVSPNAVATKVAVCDATVGKITCKRHSTPKLPLSAALPL